MTPELAQRYSPVAENDFRALKGIVNGFNVPKQPFSFMTFHFGLILCVFHSTNLHPATSETKAHLPCVNIQPSSFYTVEWRGIVRMKAFRTHDLQEADRLNGWGWLGMVGDGWGWLGMVEYSIRQNAAHLWLLRPFNMI